MKRGKKREILNMVSTMMKANAYVINASGIRCQDLTEMLAQCQDAALQIGTYLESFGDKYKATVSLLENYCENIYQLSLNISNTGNCGKISKIIRKQLTELQNRIRYEVPDDRKEIVFLPYMASMWDSLESVWKAAQADENVDVYVIPIPYYDKKPDGSFREEHYEGGLYPGYVPITRYDEYNFEERRPDVIFIHNAYDKNNYVTSVHPFFYSSNLKKYTEKLVYIPYYVLAEADLGDEEAVNKLKHFCVIPGVFHADKIIVQSESMRHAYIEILTEETKKNISSWNQGNIRQYWEEKIEGTGSPKIDCVKDIKKSCIDIPDEWKKILQKPTGGQKKVILYNTSVNGLLAHEHKMINKMQRVFEIFKENQEKISLLWRPHPLIQTTIETMCPQMKASYDAMLAQYKEEGWGIYDDSSDLDRAIALSDGYYGDPSSLIPLCRSIGMPVMIQNVDI